MFGSFPSPEHTVAWTSHSMLCTAHSKLSDAGGEGLEQVLDTQLAELVCSYNL